MQDRGASGACFYNQRNWRFSYNGGQVEDRNGYRESQARGKTGQNKGEDGSLRSGDKNQALRTVVSAQ